MNQANHIHVPIEELITPEAGKFVVCDVWVIADSKGYVIAYQGMFIYYNRSKCLLESMLHLYPDGCRVIYLPVAYLKRNYHG